MTKANSCPVLFNSSRHDVESPQSRMKMNINAPKYMPIKDRNYVYTRDCTIDDSKDTDFPCCPICIDPFNLTAKCPKLLPCLHSFCWSCLDGYIKSKNVENETKNLISFACPVCRRDTTAPFPDLPVNQWASNYPINHVLTICLGSSSEDTSRGCGPCLSDGTSSQAKKFCLDCNEYLCDGCIRYHRIFKPTKSHILMNIDEVEKNPCYSFHQSNYQSCPSHKDDEIKFFCKSHNSFCCGWCAAVTHRKCDDVLELTFASSGIKQDGYISYMHETLTNFTSRLKNVMKENDAMKDKVGAQTEEISLRMKSIRNRFNILFEKFERSVHEKCQSVKKTRLMGLEEQTDRCRRLEAAVEGSVTLLQTVWAHGTESQNFIIIQRLIPQLEDYETMIRDEESSNNHMDVRLQLVKSLEALLDEGEFGTVEVDMTPFKMVYPPVKVLAERNIKRVSVFHAPSVTENKPLYLGACYLSDRRIVLADGMNQRCCLYSTSYSFLFDVKLSSAPWKICTLGQSRIAVCLPNESKVQIMDVAEGFKTINIVSTPRPCWALQQINETELLAACDCKKEPGLSVLTLDGKEKSFFNVDSNGKHLGLFHNVAVDVLSRVIYVSEEGSDTVHSLTLDRTPRFSYRNESLKRPTGISLDGEKNIYICGYSSNNIHQLTTSGHLLKIVTAESLSRPLTICFHPRGNEFLVTCDENETEAHIFCLE